MQFKEPKPDNLGFNKEFGVSLRKLSNEDLYYISSERSVSRMLPKETLVLKDGSHIEISPLISKYAPGSPELSDSMYIILVGLKKHQNHLEGFRSLHGKINLDKKEAQFSGQIAVETTGNGLGAALEEFNSNLLQQISNRYQIKIKWEVENQNARRLKTLKWEHEKEPNDKEVKAKYENKVKEQVAWQKIYGEGGKLGFIQKEKPGDSYDWYQKTFLPESDKDTSSIEIIDSVLLDKKAVADSAVKDFVINLEKLIPRLG